MKSFLVDIWRYVTRTFKLPIVMANFFLGAFQEGDTSINPGDTVVARSIALGEPVVFVSANYRLNGTNFSCMMMMTTMMYHLNWRLSSLWIPGREGGASCKDWKYRSQRSYACRSRMHYYTMLTSQRAFRIGMGSQTHCCIRR